MALCVRCTFLYNYYVLKKIAVAYLYTIEIGVLRLIKPKGGEQ